MTKIIYRCLSGVVLLLISAQLFGQSLTVTGVVKDDTGETIPGATVLIKGTTDGTITDLDGNYTLRVSDQNAILVVSFVGYDKIEEGINGRSVIDFLLESSLTQLSEVVVIGYGTQRKKVVTGAIESISAKEITATPVTRIEQALQGRTPGVQVTNQSGQPGEAPTIRIRGAGTTGDADPIYVVDGLVVGGIDYLNPGDIESMDVLKDAASAAIYGARAANGVVLITTKSGEKGKLSVTYSAYYGVQNVAKKIDMLNAEEYRMIQNEGARNAGQTEPFDLNEIPLHDTDWQEALFTKNAPMSSHQLQILGGGEKSTFASSLGFFSQEGIIGGEKSQFDRFSARLNSTHEVNKMFTFGNNLAYTHTVRRGIASNSSFNGAFSGALNMDPLTPVFETDTDNLALPPYSNEPVISNSDGQVYGISNYVGAEVVNPLALLEIDTDQTRVDKLVGNVYGELEPIEGLKIRTSLGTDLAYVLNDGFRPLFYLNGAQNNTNKTSVNKGIDRYFTWQWDNTINYSKRIDNHNFQVLAGVSSQEVKFENLTGFNSNVPTFDPNNVYLDAATDTAWTAGGGASESALFSIFGRILYDYKDKYSLTVIVRRDGSSNFGPNSRYGTFPSIGAAWVISDEPFLQNIGKINLLKLRASWGVNGNEKIDKYQFVAPIDKSRGYTFASGRPVGSSPLRVGNSGIKWEESEQLGIAFDLGMFENQLTASVDFYSKTTKDLLETIPISAVVGNNPAVNNVGSIENKGVELSLNWRGKSGELGYSIGANTAYNKNTFTKIANPSGFIDGATWSTAGFVTRSEEGIPIAYFLGYKTNGLFQNAADVFQYINGEGDPLQPNAVPGDVKFVDVNGDGTISPDDRTIIGNPTPDWTFGFNASANYKGLDFSFLMNGTAGNDVFNGSQRRDLRFTNSTSAILDRWTGEGTSNTHPRLTWSDVNNNYRVSDLYIESGSYLRMKNIQIGYSIPISIIEKIGASNWRFYISGENLFTITGYSGADPEIGANPDNSFDIAIDRGIYPQARTYRVGTSLTF